MSLDDGTDAEPDVAPDDALADEGLGEDEPALGAVLEQDRGSLPFALIHGEALVTCAVWALGDAGVTPIDLDSQWDGVVEAEETFVLHDSLCPMTPAAFLTSCVRRSMATDTIVVGVRPVTDTVKVVDDGVVGETVDRETLRAVASPIVLPARVVAALGSLPSLDFAELVTALAARFPIDYVEAPASARRVTDLEDVEVLAALTTP